MIEQPAVFIWRQEQEEKEEQKWELTYEEELPVVKLPENIHGDYHDKLRAIQPVGDFIRSGKLMFWVVLGGLLASPGGHLILYAIQSLLDGK